MADAIVEFLVEKVGEQLINEVNFLYEVKDQVRSFEGELQQLQQFLSKANRNRDKEEDVKEWLRQLRDAAYDGEDIIDEFILRSKPGRRRQRFRIKRWVLFLRDMRARHRVGKSIVAVNQTLTDIFARKERYGIEVDRAQDVHRALEVRKSRDNRPHMDGVIVGFEDQEKRLVQRLIGQGDDELRVVSIVGMGGLGKTTLAKKVYANRDIQMRFECIVWVSVSQDCLPLQLLKELIKKTVGEVPGDPDTVALEDKLNEWLKKKKRFLIIMDDVWEQELWTRIKPAFRDIQNGSRVLLTTRSYDVAKVANPSQDPFEPDLLGEEESWELFNWKVFGRKNGCPPDLFKKGRELVEKCKRLPLAIIILGGILSFKSKTVLEWDKVLRTLDWRFDQNAEDWREVLALSYHDMPSYLKPCFLYLGLFPEDAEIWSSKIKMLWIAEGFTELYKREKMTAEEIAEFYLEELYQRSLIQVVSKRSYGGSRTWGIKSFRIHDLLRDLAISEGKEFEFLTVHRNMESNSPPKARRRLAIQSHVDEKRNNQTIDGLDLKASSPKLRSILCFNQRQLNLLPIVDGLKLLRLIDLKDVKLEQLPEEIGTLIYLRFLGLNNTRLKRLPESVGDLVNLLTLDIRSNGEVEVPLSVWKLEKLRHLYLADWRGSAQQIDSLPNIQILNNIRAGNWIANSLAKLTSLNRLKIRAISLNHENALASALPQLECLNYLSLEWLAFIPTKLPFKDLNSLYLLALHGKLERLPDVTGFPTQLMKLTLRASELNQDSMPVLGQLQSLESLKLLKNSYTGQQMVCPPSSFPKLKFLMFKDLRLVEWELEDGAMISLKRLVIEHCLLLKMLPEGLKHASDLQELELVDMPSQFINRVRKNGGEDLHKIHRSTPISLIIRNVW
ncbi:putative disease resistance protein [Acorus calamus]|uniref:Disease resistance protein n=1 Tax=Acorus calamus TaxID=4465 RepID=A0AAV9EUC1_ACOCL|nr:putative disease resistance protein [Acorus calamus]